MSGKPTHLESEVLRVEKKQRRSMLFCCFCLVGWLAFHRSHLHRAGICMLGVEEAPRRWCGWEEMRRNQERPLRPRRGKGAWEVIRNVKELHLISPHHMQTHVLIKKKIMYWGKITVSVHVWHYISVPVYTTACLTPKVQLLSVTIQLTPLRHFSLLPVPLSSGICYSVLCICVCFCLAWLF